MEEVTERRKEEEDEARSVTYTSPSISIYNMYAILARLNVLVCIITF